MALDRVILSLQYSLKKFGSVAALLSERVKVELEILRRRIRIGNIQTDIDEQHRTIGRRVVELRNNGTLSQSSGKVLKDEVVAAAITEAEKLQKNQEQAASGIRYEESGLLQGPEESEEPPE